MEWLRNSLFGKGKERSFSDAVPFDEDPCSTCDQPCDHAKVPDYLKIDYESPLQGTVKPYGSHVFFCDHNPASRWPTKLEEVSGSLAEALAGATKAAGEALGHRVVLTALDISNTPSPLQQLRQVVAPEGAVELLVFPEAKAFVVPSQQEAPKVLQEYLVHRKLPEALQLHTVLTAGGEDAPSTLPQAVDAAAAAPTPASTTAVAAAMDSLQALQLATVFVFVCAHKLRDKRCGVVGPLLLQAFRQSAPALPGQRICVYGVSHFGGHKFAGNVIMYSHQAPAGGHWYGRVTPCHVTQLLQRHVAQGHVVKELWRGGLPAVPPSLPQ